MFDRKSLYQKYFCGCNFDSLHYTVDEERAGQESGVKGDNSEQVSMKEDNTSQENGVSFSFP